MALNRSGKAAIIAQVAEVAQTAQSVVAVDYRGLNVADMTELRAEARRAGVHLQVVRNTLAQRAFQGTPYAALEPVLVGPILLAFSQSELSAAARLIQGFIKSNDKVKVKAISLGDAVLGPDQLGRVAKLPTRSEALARLLAVMQAPISQLMRTMAEPTAKLVRTVAAIRDQKSS